jgi:hypothetical protein
VEESRDTGISEEMLNRLSDMLSGKIKMPKRIKNLLTPPKKRRGRGKKRRQMTEFYVPNDLIIFLDFDGVIANHSSAKNRYFGPGNHMWYDLDVKCVEVLNRLVKVLDAKVVISSTWGTMFSQEELTNHLKSFGFTGEIVGMTIHKMSSLRDEEIKMWIEDNMYTGDYIVLDDENYHLQHIPKENFVYIKYGWENGGLTSRRANWELVRVLRKRGKDW